jgi:hypothetical protein
VLHWKSLEKDRTYIEDRETIFQLPQEGPLFISDVDIMTAQAHRGPMNNADAHKESNQPGKYDEVVVGSHTADDPDARKQAGNNKEGGHGHYRHGSAKDLGTSIIWIRGSPGSKMARHSEVLMAARPGPMADGEVVVEKWGCRC